jgi:hypothetical protein
MWGPLSVKWGALYGREKMEEKILSWEEMKRKEKIRNFLSDIAILFFIFGPVACYSISQNIEKGIVCFIAYNVLLFMFYLAIVKDKDSYIYTTFASFIAVFIILLLV